MTQTEISDALYERIKNYTSSMKTNLQEFIQSQLEMTMSEMETPSIKNSKPWTFE